VEMLINEDTTMVEAGGKEACFCLVQHSKTKSKTKATTANEEDTKYSFNSP